MRLKRKEIRFNDFELHCMDVLKEVYKVNPSHFIREAFQEKLKKEIPKLRETFSKKDLPF
jgi:hypothetical protein